VTGSASEAIGKAQPKRPQRKRELQDSLNHYLYHPLAWQLARQLAKTPLTPNIVSVIGGCFVVAAGIIYAMGHTLGWGWQGAYDMARGGRR
jgi:hypothetical protein